MTARSVLITGCSSGIGYTCAHGMKERGWRVFATARRQEDLDRLYDEGLEAIYLDYTDPNSIAACADYVLDVTGGGLYGLFNNGAYGQPGAVEDLTVETLRAQFETNLFGWHDLTCRLLPAMRHNRAGRVVQCSSVLGLVALKWRGAYNASKFAVEALSDTMRLELKGSGVHVCQIEPGPIRTRFSEHAMRHFHRRVDIANSPHRAAYEAQIAKFKDKHHPPETPAEARSRRGPAWKPSYRLGPDAVLDRLVHALESRNPKPRYYVTLPTKVMATARRLLPWRALDALCDRVS